MASTSAGAKQRDRGDRQGEVLRKKQKRRAAAALSEGDRQEEFLRRKQRRRAQFSPTTGESSTDSGEESEVGPQCVLTAAALQEMDEANTKDWKQVKKAEG